MTWYYDFKLNTTKPKIPVSAQKQLDHFSFIYLIFFIIYDQ